MEIRRIDVYAMRYTHSTGPFVLSGGRVSTGQEGTVVRLETERREQVLGGGARRLAVVPDVHVAEVVDLIRRHLGLVQHVHGDPPAARPAVPGPRGSRAGIPRTNPHRDPSNARDVRSRPTGTPSPAGPVAATVALV